MSRRGKSIETENKLVVASGWEQSRMGVTTNGCGISFGGNENVLELDSGDACITL